MPAAILDTNAVSDLMRDHPQLKARVAKHTDPILTSVVVVGEIRYGVSRLPVGKKRHGLEVRAHSILAAIRIEPVTEATADTYGRLKASLESQGLNLDDNDLWIAATALMAGNLVVTRDQIFKQIPGLQVEDWSV
jgi:predicted nucleic acid-binding protein